MKCTIPLVLLVMTLSAAGVGAGAAGFKFVKSARADLDGDGKREAITIDIRHEPRGSGDRFTLKVGGVSVKGSREGVEGFAIMDLDTRDRYREVAVFSNGPSDDPEYRIYWFDGKRLRPAGVLGGGLTIPGSGIVLKSWWTGNFMVKDKYLLDKVSHILKRVPQEMYYVGEEHKVLQPFPLVHSTGSGSVVANLEKGSRVLVIALKQVSLPKKPGGDPDRGTEDWLLIKSRTGLMGWAKLWSVGGKLDLANAD